MNAIYSSQRIFEMRIVKTSENYETFAFKNAHVNSPYHKGLWRKGRNLDEVTQASLPWGLLGFALAVSGNQEGSEWNMGISVTYGSRLHI